MRKILTLFFILTLCGISVFSQIPSAQNATAPVVYPKVVGYLSFILPLVTINKNETTNDFSDFKNGFSIGFPVGVNVLYSSKFGFSYEITPTIESEDNSTKTSKILIDPGPMFRFKQGFTFIPRLAFETSGRYGFTPVFNEIVKRTKPCNYFIAVSLPTRFGNSELPTIGGNLQIGLIFN